MPPQRHSDDARARIESARVLRRIREAGQSLTPAQRALEAWAQAFVIEVLPTCDCGERGHTSHRSAAQEACHRILSGQGSKQRVVHCRRGGRLLHVERAVSSRASRKRRKG